MELKGSNNNGLDHGSNLFTVFSIRFSWILKMPASDKYTQLPDGASRSGVKPLEYITNFTQDTLTTISDKSGMSEGFLIALFLGCIILFAIIAFHKLVVKTSDL